MTREEYLSLLANEADRNIAYDPELIGRYNVAPGTRVLLDEQLQLDPVHCGYAPGLWDKPPLIKDSVASTHWTHSSKQPVNVNDRPYHSQGVQKNLNVQ